VVAGTAVAVTAAAVSFGIGNAVADVSSAPTGTALCVQNGVGLVLTPTPAGRCIAGQTPMALANLSGVIALSNSVGQLQNGVGQLQNGVGQLQNGQGALQNSVNGLQNGFNGLQSLTISRFTGGSSIGANGNGSTSTYTVPAAVTELQVELWGGGGGGGGGGTGGDNPGGGGAQGDYTHSVINVVPGDTCTVVVGSGGSGGPQTSALGSAGVTGGAPTFSCTQSPASLNAPGGQGAAAFQFGGSNPTPGDSSAAYQTYAGQRGTDGFGSMSTGAPGGGVGFPGTGGRGGNSADGVSVFIPTAGQTGSPGLVLITPVSKPAQGSRAGSSRLARREIPGWSAHRVKSPN
jgi:X-X-X-Leu-X-X-Gly heptad repeat protein